MPKVAIILFISNVLFTICHGNPFDPRAYSPTLALEKRSEESLVLEGACEEVVPQKIALDHWVNTYGLKSERPDLDGQISRTPEGSCELELAFYLPKLFVKFHSATLSLLDPIHAGPNCFASTWRLNGFLQNFLQASSYLRERDTGDLKEFYSGFVKSGFCSEVYKPSLAEPGDVFMVLNQRGTPTHGLVYISDFLGLSKFGSAADGAFMIQPPREQARYYGIEKEERYAEGKNLKIFRCPKLRRLNQEKSKHLGEELTSIWGKYESLAASMEPYVFSSAKIDSKLSSLWEKSAKVQIERLENFQTESQIEKALIPVLRQGLWNLTRIR